VDEIAVKALLVGVGVFITIIITTLIIAEFFEIRQIYKHVAETDVSFESKFDELSKFRDPSNEFRGIDVKNYIKKYKNDGRIELCVEEKCEDEIDLKAICDKEIDGGIKNCSDIYNAKFEDTNVGYRITFNKIEDVD